MLKDVLKKRADGLELTEEELALLKEFDETQLELQSRLKLLEEEKTLNTQKLEATNTELASKLEELTKASNDLKSTKDERDTLIKLLEDEKTSVAIKEELARINAEKQLKAEKEKKEMETKKEIEKYETALKQLQNEVDIMKKQNEMTNFKYEIAKKKEEYPYLESELQAILEGVEAKGLEMSRTILEFIINSKNHEEEMKKYLAKKQAGSNIFNNAKEVKTKKEKEVDPRYKKYEGLNIDLMKEYGFVSR